jgi:DNA replication protein DnaC
MGQLQSKPAIFFSFANDRNGTIGQPLNLPDEERRVRQTLEAAPGLCEFVPRSNCTADDIFKVLQDARYRNRIAIFHFSGHANSFQLLLETRDGEAAAADAGGLASFLAAQRGLRLVFLNGCSTRQQAQGLLDANKNLAAVVATSRAIDDRVAIEFSERFYAALAQGTKLRTAFDETKKAITTTRGSDHRKLYFGDAQNDATDDSRDSSGAPWDLYERKDSQAASDWTLLHALKTMALRGWYESPSPLRVRPAGPDVLRTSTVSSPLLPYWREYLSRPLWPEMIRGAIDRATGNADHAPSKHGATQDEAWEKELAAIKAINLERDYESIWMELKVGAKALEHAAQRQLDSLHSAINRARASHQQTSEYEAQLPAAFAVRDLARELTNQPLFGRCFLAAGGYGTGKSHFVAAALEAAIQDELVCVTLDVDEGNTGDLDNWLLHQVEVRTGVQFTNLGDLHQYLQACEIRLVCVVDDLHRSFFLPSAAIFQRLIEWIRKRTHFSRLLWLITTQDTLFDELFRDEEFWQTHGNNSDSCLAGWYLLDNLNREKNIGLQIVREFDVGEESQSRLDVDQGFQQYLQSPMMAWLYLDFVNEEAEIHLGSLNTTLFVNRQWKRILANRPPSRIDDRQLRAACKQVASVIVMSQHMYPAVDKILEQGSITSDWRGSSYEILEDLGLIRRVTHDDDAYEPDERLQLRFENLWYRWIAIQLNSHFRGRRPRPEDVRRHFVQWFGEIHNEFAREGIWEFLLLTIDEADKVPEPRQRRRKAFGDQLRLSQEYQARPQHQTPLLSANSWEWAFYDRPLPLAAVFFGASNATPGQRQLVLDLVISEKQMSLSPRESFALLYFLGACDNLSPSERLRAMRGHHRGFGETNLATYYCHVVNTILTAVGDNREMINCMHELSGSFRLNREEDELVSKRVAWAALWRLIKISNDNEINNDNVESIVTTAVSYLHGEYGQGLGLDRFIEEHTRNSSWLFHEWLNQMLCERMLDHFGPRRTFQLLYSKDWYRLEIDSGRRQSYFVRRVMSSKQKQANLAFGRWYRETQHNLSDTDSALLEFIELCSALFDRQFDGETLPPHTKIIAFYMVRHTVPHHDRDDEYATHGHPKVDHRFRPLVEAMRNDPDTKVFFDNPRTAFLVEGDEMSDPRDSSDDKPNDVF